MSTLEKANKVRRERSRDKRLLGEGHVSASWILRNVPEHWRTATVVELVTAVPGVGRVKAHALCRAADVEPTMSLIDLPLPKRLLVGQLIARREV